MDGAQWMGCGSALTEHTVQQPFHLGQPNSRVRLQAVRLEDVHNPARRYGSGAARPGGQRAPHNSRSGFFSSVMGCLCSQGRKAADVDA